MDIFNLISGTCSIIGLMVSLFVASKVTKLKINDNQGTILSGDGTQKTAKDHSAIADNNSTVNYTDNRGATILGELDELPVLTEKKYPILLQNIDQYRKGVAGNTCDLTIINNSDSFCFNVDFLSVTSDTNSNRWIGYSIKSLPMNDWRSFVNNAYKLCFTYKASGSISEFWIEFTNFQSKKKIYKEKIALSNNQDRFVLNLERFKNNIDDWKSVDEICFVFIPDDCIGKYGTVFISDFEVCKL